MKHEEVEDALGHELVNAAYKAIKEFETTGDELTIKAKEHVGAIGIYGKMAQIQVVITLNEDEFIDV